MNQYIHGSQSNILRFALKHATTGQGLTGLTTASSGLIISTIADVESAAVVYTGANIETIVTIGTYAAPTASKCRFKEIDATNHKGVYEVHLADARFAVAGAQRLVISISGVATLLDTDKEVELIDPITVSEIQSGLATAAKMLAYFQILARSDADIPAELTTELDELNEDLASGVGTYDPTAESLQAAEASVVTLSASERNAIADATLARSLGTEAVSAVGAVPTVQQAMFEILSLLGEFSISGTTITMKKRDGTTTLFTSTINSATVPTARLRAT